MLGAVLEALGLWALVLAGSMALTSLAASALGVEDDRVLGAVSQGSFIVLSLVLARLVGIWGQLGLTPDLGSSLRALVVSLPAALVVAIPAARLAQGYRPPFLPEDLPSRLAFALALAPVGEEIFFRGLLEGQLLSTLGAGSGAGLWIAIIIPAALFSLVHVAPFSKAPRGYLASVLVGAFVVGLLAGHFRAVSGSLAPAVVTHASFNLAGVIVEKVVG